MTDTGPTIVDARGSTAAAAATRTGTAWIVLAALAVVGSTVLLGVEHARSWHFFADAVDLAGPPWGHDRGLGLYRAHPEFQFGPLSVLVASMFWVLPDPLRVWAAMVVGSLAGVGALALSADALRRRHRSSRRRISPVAC